MDAQDDPAEVLRLPFVFIPDGAEAPAAWRAAHPDAIRIPARMVVRGGVRKVQFAVPVVPPPPPVSGSPRQDRAGELQRWLKESWSHILSSEGDRDRWIRPPPGSRPIDETPWSGDHGEIKDAIGAEGTDDTRIAPNGDVWGKNPDETRTNHGPASDLTGSGKAAGRKGRDRNRRRGERE